MRALLLLVVPCAGLFPATAGQETSLTNAPRIDPQIKLAVLCERSLITLVAKGEAEFHKPNWYQRISTTDLDKQESREFDAPFIYHPSYRFVWRLQKHRLWTISLYEMDPFPEPFASMQRTPIEAIRKDKKLESWETQLNQGPIQDAILSLKYDKGVDAIPGLFVDIVPLQDRDCIITLLSYTSTLDFLRKMLEKEAKRDHRKESRETTDSKPDNSRKACTAGPEDKDGFEIAILRADGRIPPRGGLSLENWREIDRIPVDFKEPFHAFLVKDVYYFIFDTPDGGKVYMAKKPEKEKAKRKLEPIWTDAKKPITAIIDDQDSGKIFVFGKNKNAVINAKDFYFELAEKPDPQEFATSDLKELKADEPIKTLWQYATLLAERRKEKK